MEQIKIFRTPRTAEFGKRFFPCKENPGLGFTGESSPICSIYQPHVHFAIALVQSLPGNLL